MKLFRIANQNPLRKACAIYDFRQDNLFKYSEDFTNSSWSKVKSTFTDGKFIEDTTTGVHNLSASAIMSIAGLTYCVSFLVKAAGRKFVRISDSYFDIETGVIVYGSGSFIEPVGDGVYRISKIQTSGGGAMYHFLALHNDLGQDTYTGDGTSGIYIYSAQCTVGSVPKPYKRTQSMQEVEEISKPLVNLIPPGKEKFENWMRLGGVQTITLTQNQMVEEWNTTEATRIQITGGSNVSKLAYTAGVTIKGVPYMVSIRVKNLGTNAVKIASNMTDGYPTYFAVNPGVIKDVCLSTLGNGTSDVQLRFELPLATDSIDVLVYKPMICVGLDNKEYISPTHTANFPIKKSGIRGSSTSSDTADPPWTGRGQKGDGVDDLDKFPVTFDPNNDFTVFIVADVGTDIPTITQSLWCLGLSTDASSRLSIYRNISTGELKFTAYMGGEQASIIPLVSLAPGLRLYKLTRELNILTIRDMFGASGTPSTTVIGTLSPDLQTLFALGRTTYTSYSPAEVCFMVQFVYACSASESIRIAQEIKKQMLQRNINLDKKYSATNIGINGNITSTANWTGFGLSSLTAQNNILTAVSNGILTYPHPAWQTNLPIANYAGKKMYIRAKVMLPDLANLGNLTIYAHGTTGENFTVIGANNLTPSHFIAGEWVLVSGICTVNPTGQTGNITFDFLYTYNPASGGLSKALKIEEAMLVDLTHDFAGDIVGTGLEPSKEWCDITFPDYFEGTKSIN